MMHMGTKNVTSNTFTQLVDKLLKLKNLIMKQQRNSQVYNLIPIFETNPLKAPSTV